MPDSVANNYSSSISATQYFDVVKHFPGVKTSLLSWQAVRSTAINITYPKIQTSRNIKMYLRIAFDLLNGTKPEEDYCLAKFDQEKTQIVCDPAVGYPHNYDSALSSLTFSLSSPGAYAVIFCPNSTALPPLRECRILCRYFS